MRKLICGLLLGIAASAADTTSALAIRNARIVTVNGPVIPKGTVLVHNGLIDAVGENVAIPAGAWVIEGEGLTVYPGLIDALSTLGIADAAPVSAATAGRGGRTAAAAISAPAADAAPPARGPEDRPMTTSWLRAADLIKASDRRIESARNVGFTSAVVFPTRGIIAGQGAVVNLAGERERQMVVASPAGMYVTMSTSGFGGGFPASLMGTIAYIRQIYIDADYYRAAKADYAKNHSGKKRPEYDRALEGLLEAPRVLLPATYVRELERMIRLSADLKSPPLLYGGHEAYKAADMLKQQNATVLVNLKWPEKARDADPDMEESLRTLELREKAASSPAALAKAGVKFAFYASGIDTARDIPKAVKKAIDAGLSPEDAVRALTLSPAEIYGVSDRMGSIEKGKIANLIVTNGDLFQDRTQVKYVFIDGVKMEPTPEIPPATPAQETQK
jgi:imidazolonepropionase-like amidohydrolase